MIGLKVVSTLFLKN